MNKKLILNLLIAVFDLEILNKYKVFNNTFFTYINDKEIRISIKII